jgi:hypothetical protein
VNAAIFSLVDAVLLRTLPVQRPSELVFIEAAGNSGRGGAPPYPCFERFRRETSAFVGLAAFAVVAIVSVALGIGVNAAIFSLVDAVLLRTLPVQRPSELVFIEAVGNSGRGGAPPYPCFERLPSVLGACSRRTTMQPHPGSPYSTRRPRRRSFRGRRR